jgi:hypothetical protein
MKTLRKLAVVLGIALSLAFAAAHAAPRVIDSASADSTLKPGDVLIKFLGDQRARWTQKLIQGGQRATRFLAGLFHKALRKGDPKAFHTAIYVGRGEVAEAHGGSPSTARVGVRSIDAHRGYLFQVYRPKENALAARAAEIARRWANGRMKYSVPIDVPLRHARIGSKALREVMRLAKGADTPGGPASVKKMFCSEFVVAAYQAAYLAPTFAGPTVRDAGAIRLPIGIDSQASHTSPLYMHARLREAVERGLWSYLGDTLIRPGTSQEETVRNALAEAEKTRGPDVTASLQHLGIPTKGQYADGDKRYARNPWSLFVFGGRLFIGNGNSNNKGPAKNAGPVRVWSYDLAARRFIDEGKIDDEQIDRFRVLKGALVIPGHDPAGAFFGKGSWLKGNYYRRDEKGWKKVRTLPGGIHNYDMIEHRGTIFAGLGTPLGASIARSTDGGKKWKSKLLLGKFRVRTFLEIGGRLFVSTSGAGVFEWTGKSATRFLGDLFVGIDKRSRKKAYVQKAAWTPKQTAYIVARKLIDHDGTPLGLFTTTTGYDARPVALPHKMVARDVLSVGGTFYVLGSTNGNVAVYATRDLVAFKEVLRFQAPTFARSFAVVQNGNRTLDFYFGLGSEPDALHDATGEILRAAGVTAPY